MNTEQTDTGNTPRTDAWANDPNVDDNQAWDLARQLEEENTRMRELLLEWFTEATQNYRAETRDIHHRTGTLIQPPGWVVARIAVTPRTTGDPSKRFLRKP